MDGGVDDADRPPTPASGGFAMPGPRRPGGARDRGTDDATTAVDPGDPRSMAGPSDVSPDAVEVAPGDGHAMPVERTLEIRPLIAGDAVHARRGIGGTGRAPEAAIDSHPTGRRYRIVRELGRGGVGVVYEAWDECLERTVAIKSLQVRGDRPAPLRRFLREAKIASRLNHPGIMAVHEFGVTDDGQAYMVMRHLRGQTLRQVLDARQDPADDEPRLIAVFLQACQAVAAAHGAGVIHRDLKPANVMVGEYGLVTVMDWGLAKVLHEAEGPADGFGDATLADPLHTVCGTLFGTPGYLSPEQARGATDSIDRRSDVFGLGCILCEILTGAPPFCDPVAGNNWRRAAAGDVGEAIARLDRSRGPGPVVALARACLAPDPDGRPADAGVVVDALVAYLEGGQRRAEQQLVRFFDLSVDLFCVAGLDGFFRRVNGNFLRLLGRSERDLLATRFIDFVHPADREATLAEVARLSRGETTLRFRNRYLRDSGAAVWLEWNARAVAEEGVIYAVARDVTERVRLEADLEQSRRDVDDFMENANVSLHRVDADGIIVWANRAELEFLGYRREEYVGQPIARFHADPPVIADILARLGAGETLSGYEARLVARDGSIRCVAIHSSVHSENGVFRHTRCLSIAVGPPHLNGRVVRAEDAHGTAPARPAVLDAHARRVPTGEGP
jgi:serine/threonine-protein kinase